MGRDGKGGRGEGGREEKWKGGEINKEENEESIEMRDR